jgi:hypothetical protein
MVRAGHPSIFDSKAKIERAALDGQSRRLHWRQGASVMTGVGDVLRLNGTRIITIRLRETVAMAVNHTLIGVISISDIIRLLNRPSVLGTQADAARAVLSP